MGARMRVHEHNLIKHNIAKLTLQLLHMAAMFLQDLICFLHYFSRFEQYHFIKMVLPHPPSLPSHLRALFSC